MATARSKAARKAVKADAPAAKKNEKKEDYIERFRSGFSAAYEKLIKERKAREQTDRA